MDSYKEGSKGVSAGVTGIRTHVFPKMRKRVEEFKDGWSLPSYYLWGCGGSYLERSRQIYPCSLFTGRTLKPRFPEPAIDFNGI